MNATRLLIGGVDMGARSNGIGRFGGTAGVAEFTDLRWISIATRPRHRP